MRRNQMVWFICCLSIFLLFLMDLFHYFTIEEQLKMIQDFSLGLMNLTTLLLVVYYPSHLIKEEFREKTIYSLLSRPVSRTSIILGKALSVAILVGLALLGNLLSLGIMLLIKGGSLDATLLTAVSLIYLKNIMLIGFSLLFGISPLSDFICTLLTFFIYGVGTVKSYFMEGLDQIPVWMQTFYKMFFTFIPNLRIYDLVESITLNKDVPLSHIMNGFLHFLGVSILIYGIAIFFFNRKEV